MTGLELQWCNAFKIYVHTDNMIMIILATEHNKEDLAILEALLIKQHGAKINGQTEDFNNTLKIF